MTTQRYRLYIINDPTVLRIVPQLAAEIGLPESIMLMQLDFWINQTDNEREGRYWTYQSTRKMQREAFPFWSLDTINRTVHSLEKRRLIIVQNYNQHAYDFTRWFAINPEGIAQLATVKLEPYENRTGVYENRTALTQNRTGSTQNRTTIPETTTETTQETPARAGSRKHAPRTSQADTRTAHPAIQAIKAATGYYPSKTTYDAVIRRLGDKPDTARLRAAVEAWALAGNKATNIGGIIDWYEYGIPDKRRANGAAAAPPQSVAPHRAGVKQYGGSE